jgi:hypothetical protein
MKLLAESGTRKVGFKGMICGPAVPLFHSQERVYLQLIAPLIQLAIASYASHSSITRATNHARLMTADQGAAAAAYADEAKLDPRSQWLRRCLVHPKQLPLVASIRVRIL